MERGSTVNGWQSIEPEPQCLTASEQSVKALLDRGWTYPMIATKLHMSHETTRDIIFEIRKKEGIMRKPTITDDEKQTMKRLYAEGKTIQEIADATGRGRSSVDRIVNDRKPAQINPEFEAATNEMIAELRNDTSEAAQIAAANEARIAAEVAELEDVENGIPNTPLIAANAEKKSANAEPEEIPGYIRSALYDQICAINLEIEQREQRIAELKMELVDYEAEREQIRAWMEAHT